ncbi:MAG: hypothetical protein R3B40_03530 [Polyangiales bacterium]
MSLVTPSAVAHAETIFVTTTAPDIDVAGAECDSIAPADSVTLAGLCPDGSGGYLSPCDAEGISLSEAICAANANPGPDVIVLADGAVYTLAAAHNSWYGWNGLPIITSEITIDGRGARIVRDSVENFRFFVVSGPFGEAQAPTVGQSAPAGTLLLQDLTLVGGAAIGAPGRDGAGASAGLGGAVYNQGTLVLRGVTIRDGVARGGVGSDIGATFTGGAGLSAPAVWGGGGGGFGANLAAASPHGGGFGGATTASNGGFGGGGAGGYHGGFGGGGGAFLYSSGTGIAGRGGFGGGGGSGGDCVGCVAGGAGGFGGGGGGGGAGFGVGGFGGGNGSVAGIYSHGGSGAGFGGAIFNHGGELRVVSATFGRNAAQGGLRGISAQAGRGYGGAIFNLNGEVVLIQATFYENSASTFGSTIVVNPDGGQDVYNKQVADADLVGIVGVADVSLFGSLLGSGTGGVAALVNDAGSFSGSSNVIVAATLLPGSIANVAPALEMLGDYGGFTETYAVAATEELVNDCASADEPGLVDQRGVGRPSDGCDPGAYQRSVPCESSSVCAAECTDGFCCVPGCDVCSESAGGDLDGACASYASAPIDAGVSDAGTSDTGVSDMGVSDMGVTDTGTEMDAAVPSDSGTLPHDVGAHEDLGDVSDVSVDTDEGTGDLGSATDAGEPEMGRSDTGTMAADATTDTGLTPVDTGLTPMDVGSTPATMGGGCAIGAEGERAAFPSWVGLLIVAIARGRRRQRNAAGSRKPR